MDKETEIEKMAKDLDEHCDAFEFGYSFEMETIEFAEALYNAGYGHIPTALNAYLHSNEKAAAMIDSIVAIKQRQAVKEFAESLKLDSILYLLKNYKTVHEQYMDGCCLPGGTLRSIAEYNWLESEENKINEAIKTLEEFCHD